ncbi:alpha/beta fold hydrolase [Rhodococcus tukisamuensis]|uniref:Pimeloyl-ACP methyl ester carboxylesterase n=1 Tax=Rhodococcus tukisamuensis TaxID=168276 RepID=A0A1G6MEW8_9NOCA|nr:alpha/beta hydrolase [Rhodococcus tukisamuensis]SDC54168.1 Pimeloyl-ACP methyl ester carboxylesterase [Rhodococcus tukisamuensis]
MATVTSHQVTSADGTVIAYERSGDGPPALIVGGAFNDRRTAGPLAAALASEFTTIAYDRRGRGSSGDTAPYAPEREIEDLAAILDDIGRPTHVYGLSSGAVLALEAAAAGLPVARLAVFEPPYSDGPRTSDDYLTRLAELTAAGRRGDAVELFMTEAVGVPAEAVPSIRQSPAWVPMKAIAHTLLYDALVVESGAMPRERLATISVPTLALASAGSPPWLREAAAAVAEVVPGAGMGIVDGGFHDVTPEVLAPVLSEFFGAGH